MTFGRVALWITLTSLVGATPTLGADGPRLAGPWSVTRELRAARNVAGKAGYHDRQIWRFAPTCDRGGCDVILKRRTPGPGSMALQLRLRRIRADLYVGVDHYFNSARCDHAWLSGALRDEATY